MQQFKYASFFFRYSADVCHFLDVSVNTSMDHLEWRLYANGNDLATFLDGVTDVSIPEQLADSLSYSNVLAIYKKLLTDSHS
jgi:hypothetical protein